MNEFVNKVKETIKLHGLLRREGRVIVAVSGGADSTALLVALVQLGYDCAAAHCNFHLRGEESNRDMRHVEKLTRQLNVDLYVKDFNVEQRMKESGESMEMACRSLRYEWFFDLLDRENAQAIAVGHHREDQVETLFLNLLRGSGIMGLAGMRHRSRQIIRPLLDIPKTDIESFLIEEGVDWITDSSNATDAFARNKLRNRVLPVLNELFPQANQAILRSMEILRENESLYNHLIALRSEKYVDRTTGEINLIDMASQEPWPAPLLFEMIKGEGFNRSQADDMLRAAKHSGGVFYAGNHCREVDHGILRAARAGAPVEANCFDITLFRDILSPVHIQVTVHDVAQFKPERNPNVAFIDADAADAHHRWQLRHWKRGDRMQPYGMSGSKLISDIFADAKLNAQQKKEIWLMTCDGQIVWAVGLRASALFTIGPSTRSYLRLELKS